MYKTLQGAKARAKDLKKSCDAHGIEYPLHSCQQVVATAGGFPDWHALDARMGRAPAPDGIPRDVYERRLLKALPEPCRAPAMAALDTDGQPRPADGEASPWWFKAVFPYVFAIAVLHRSGTAMLRPGSGPGQKLRANLVVGLLLNMHGGRSQMPRLDPDTLTLIYRGTHKDIFRDDADHPGFAAEIERLVTAGIIELRPNQVRILPPDPEAVKDRVLKGWIEKAGDRTGDHGKAAIEALTEALSAIGVRDALRVAGAILDYGSDAYDRPHGADHELLSSLAEEGDVETFAKAYGIFVAVHPTSAGRINESVPAKISSLYLARHKGYGAARLMAYTGANPDWADRLRQRVAEPAGFVATVAAMALEIEAA